MAEDEVNYASVVFRTNKQPSPEGKREDETVEVTEQSQKLEETAETNVSAGFSADKENSRHHRWQHVVCCLGIVCVVLLLALVALSVYFTTIRNQSEGNQQLEATRNNLTEQIRKLEVNLNELNISRAQWSLDNYCPKDKGRQCNYCQNSWTVSPSNSSCYAINDAQPPDQKTWEEAREDCRGKNSDLAVIVNEEEKTFTTQNSWSNPNIRGYWIGLRGENGTWKWVDGSLLNQSSWIQQSPTDGSCVTSLQGRGWKSVNCGEKNAWICKKKALSV